MACGQRLVLPVEPGQTTLALHEPVASYPVHPPRQQVAGEGTPSTTRSLSPPISKANLWPIFATHQIWMYFIGGDPAI